MKQSCLAVFFAAFFACNVQAQEPFTNAASPALKDSSLHDLRKVAKESGPAQIDQELPISDNIFPPVFPGGENALLRFLGENIRYPESAIQENIEGTVKLTFVIEKDGSISQINILRDIGGGCALEAARVVALMPKWTPGMVDGEPVKVRYTLPVRFKFGQKKSNQKKWRQRDSLFGN
jgi:TonB family protein